MLCYQLSLKWVLEIMQSYEQNLERGCSGQRDIVVLSRALHWVPAPQALAGIALPPDSLEWGVVLRRLWPARCACMEGKQKLPRESVSQCLSFCSCGGCCSINPSRPPPPPPPPWNLLMVLWIMLGDVERTRSNPLLFEATEFCSYLDWQPSLIDKEIMLKPP